jgi:hypothetical protein
VAKGGLRFWHLVVIVVLAAMVGTALGDVLGRLLPGRSAAAFLASGVRLGTTSPLDLDLSVVQLTLGAGVRLTVLGGLMAALALVLFIRRV